MTITRNKENIVTELIKKAQESLDLSIEAYEDKVNRLIDEHTSFEEVTDILIKTALENIDEATPNWTFFASRLYLQELYRKAANNRNYDIEDKYGDLYQLIKQLTDKGIYTPILLKKYTKEEIDFFNKHIDPEKDKLFHYLAIYTLTTRYLATDND